MKNNILIAIIMTIVAIVSFKLGVDYKEALIKDRIRQFPNERESYSETEMEYIIFGESQL